MLAITAVMRYNSFKQDSECFLYAGANSKRGSNMKTLKTDRLILRGFRKSDLNDFYEYAKNPRVGPPAGWEPHASLQMTKSILKVFMEQDEVWAIVLRENKKVIGSVGLHKDEKRPDIHGKMLSYALSEDYWGRGLMTEAVKEVIAFAFCHDKLDILSVYHYPHNERSCRVIEKCGFVREGVLRSCSRIYNGVVMDNVCYSMLKAEYKRLYE